MSPLNTDIKPYEKEIWWSILAHNRIIKQVRGIAPSLANVKNGDRGVG